MAFEGDGCGAAMRVAPVGAMYSSEKIHELINSVFEASVSTHGGRIAICGSAAIAAAVSAAVDNKSEEEILNHAVLAAKLAEKCRPASSNENIAALIESVYEDLSKQNEVSLDYIKERYMPWQTPNIVALAINFAVLTKSAEKTILLASNLGGDTDSVASMGAAIAGAKFPKTVNDTWYQVVEEVNGNELVRLASRIAGIRENQTLLA